MDKELANYVAKVAFRSSSDLSQLVSIVKEHIEDPEEYERIAKDIAHACGEIGIRILFPIFKEHPEIEEQIKNIIDKYGRLV